MGIWKRQVDPNCLFNHNKVIGQESIDQYGNMKEASWPKLSLQSQQSHWSREYFKSKGHKDVH